MRRERLFLSPPHMGGSELDFVREAFASNYIAPLGPMVDAFEREFAVFAGISHSLAVASGTAAMHLAMRELGVGAGDLVLASTLTFIGSVSPAAMLGAEIVFLDSDHGSWTLDPDLLAAEMQACRKRGRMPRAVVPTDLYGQSADLDRIVGLCAPDGVAVVADAAEAVGARYKDRHAGKGARAAVFSFNGNKIITTSGGGMLASDDPELIRHARFVCTQAREPLPHYEHREIGYNYRMSNVVAAIGRGQLRVIDERVRRKREIFSAYRERLGDLPGVAFMPEAPYGAGNRWLTVMQLDPAVARVSPERIRLALEAENIEARPLWKPMHLQPVFAACSVRSAAHGVETGLQAAARLAGRTAGSPGSAMVSETLFEQGICLPSGTAMTAGDIDLVVAIVRDCLRRAGS